jgi:hypothetical protein
MTPLMPQAPSALNPKEAECMGLYLYGSGYYAREDQQMAIVRGERTEAETFERQCEKAWRKNRMSPLVVAAMRMKQGNPEPYMKLALENYRRGASDRRRERGSAIVRKG